jgi:protein subunit release factor B
MDKKLMFSVTQSDCEMQVFRAGGAGGQNQNKTSSGVRFIHHPSGARGESREYREQLHNKRAAFKRMTESIDFKLWIQRQLAKESPEEWVEKQIEPKNLRIEARVNGKWEKMENDTS